MCDTHVIDPCETWIETIQAARKRYRCDCCDGPIEPRTRYKRIFMVTDGYPSTERECVPCGEMMVQFKARHRQYFSPAGMRVLLEDCLAADTTVTDTDEVVPTTDDGRLWVEVLAAMDARARAYGASP